MQPEPPTGSGRRHERGIRGGARERKGQLRKTSDRKGTSGAGLGKGRRIGPMASLYFPKIIYIWVLVLGARVKKGRKYWD